MPTRDLLLLFALVLVLIAPIEGQTCIQVCDDYNKKLPVPGPKGAQGITGARGATGPAGEPGLKGEKGDGIGLVADRFDAIEKALKELKTQTTINQMAIVKIQSMLDAMSKMNNTAGAATGPAKVAYQIERTPQKGTYKEAMQMCKEMGGELVHKSLVKVFGERSYRVEMNQMIRGVRWIGLNDMDVEGYFKLIDGRYLIDEDIIYAWAADEPNNNNNEDCVVVRTDYRLNDVSCKLNAYGLCEVIIEGHYEGHEHN